MVVCFFFLICEVLTAHVICRRDVYVSRPMRMIDICITSPVTTCTRGIQQRVKWMKALSIPKLRSKERTNTKRKSRAKSIATGDFFLNRELVALIMFMLCAVGEVKNVKTKHAIQFLAVIRRSFLHDSVLTRFQKLWAKSLIFF